MRQSVTLPTGQVAFLFTDIVGSTRRWEDDADTMSRSLGLHRQTTRSAVERHRGCVVKDTGDGFLAAFGSATDAVSAGVTLQLALSGSTLASRS